MAVGIAGSAPPEVLARTIGVLGRLQFADQLVLDELARGLMPGVGQLQPQQLQELVRPVCDSSYAGDAGWPAHAACTCGMRLLGPNKHKAVYACFSRANYSQETVAALAMHSLSQYNIPSLAVGYSAELHAPKPCLSSVGASTLK